MTHTLTPRELTVLRLAAQGCTNREISTALGLSEKSIEHMLGSTDTFRAIYAKIGVKNRAEAVAWYTARYGLDQGIHPARAADHLLELATNYVTRVYQMRVTGNPHLALEMAQFIATVLGEAAYEALSPGYQEALLTIRTQALLEQGTVYLETVPPDALYRMIRPLAHEIRVMAKASDRAQLLGGAYILLAGAANITQRYPTGMTLYATALDLVDEVNLTLRGLRGIAIAAAYLSEVTVVTAVSERVRRLMENGHWVNAEQVCETLEGVGRAQGLMGSASAYTAFAEAEEMLAVQGVQNHLALPLRRLQLLVSRLEVTQHLAPTDKTLIESLGRDALALAHDYGYPRHAGLIEQMLTAALT